MKYLSIIVLIGFFLLCPSIVLAEPIGVESLEDSLVVEPIETSLYFQTGLFYRLGGNEFIENPYPPSVLGTIDISFLKLDPTRPTWGWGIHSAISDNNEGGLRFAPKAIYRVPFSRPTGSFFEASGGMYFLAINDLEGTGRLNFPGYFAEAGLGRNHVSIVLGGEAFPAENFEGPTTQGVQTNYWLGVKASQEYGLLTLGATGIAIALLAVAIVNSGILD